MASVRPEPPARRLIPGVIAAMLSAPSTAWALDCGKAKTQSDIVICAEAPLLALNDRMTRALSEALLIVSGEDRGQSAAARALRSDQTAWLAERARCGAERECLRVATERRITVLNFGRDDGAPGPMDPYVGLYGGISANMNLAVLGLIDGTAAVAVAGRGPKGAICDYSAVGRIDKQGRLRVGRPSQKGGGGLIIETTAKGVQIADIPENRSASTLNCGQGGSFVTGYFRKTKR